MAGKQKVKALRVLNWDYKKNEKNNMLPMLINEQQWVCCAPNVTEKKGDYEYKEDTFTLDILNGTGFIDSKGDKWLLCCLEFGNAKDLVEISVKDWSDKWELNKEATDQALADWKEQNCLTAIKTNGFVQLELMAEMLNGISFEYRECKVDLTLDSEKINKDACKWFIEFQSEHGDVPKLSRTEKDKTIIKNVKAAQACNFEPTINITDPTDFSEALLPFSFEEDEAGEFIYPNLKITWTPPVIEERKSSGSGWSNGSTVNVSETSPKDRLEFVYQFTGTNTPEGLMNANPKYLLTALHLTGVSPSSAYIALLTGKDINESNQHQEVRQLSEATNNSSNEKETVNSNASNNGHKGTPKESATLVDYTQLITDWANNNPNKLSPELELTDKSDQWKRLFYALLTGTIGQKPLLGSDGRANTVMIKKEFGKKLHELDEDELGKLAEKLDVKMSESKDLPLVTF